MNIAAIIDRAQDRFGDTSAEVYTEQQWLDYTLDRHRMIWAVRADWPFKQAQQNVSISAGARTGTLANGVWRVQAVRDSTNGNVLLPLQKWTDVNDQSPMNDDDGVPVAYQVYGATIRVWPKSASALTLVVDGLIEVPTITCSDEPAFPEQYHPALVEGVLADAYLDDGNVQQYQLHHARYEAIVAQMVTDLIDARDEGFVQIVDSWW